LAGAGRRTLPHILIIYTIEYTPRGVGARSHQRKKNALKFGSFKNITYLCSGMIK
jgi:hypothetical protein